MQTILVSVVNYCDPEFYSTVKSLWDKANKKDNLYFSLVSEDKIRHDFSFIPSDQIRYLHFDLSKYRGGLGWARNLAVSIDTDYDYLMQFDSHTYAHRGWDEKAINNFENVKKISKKCIIAYAPADYEILSNGEIDTNTGNMNSISATYYNELIPGFKFPGYSLLNIGEVRRSYWATCCYLFAPKQWVEEVGISRNESFNTEEFCLSLRTYAKGWEIYSIGARDVFHHQSHRQPNGTVTRASLRPWADDRRDNYWRHVTEATDRLSLLMSGQLDISKEIVGSFFNSTGIDLKYLDYIDNYSSHVVLDNRGFGMPPRRDI
jgi:hypothetical protein